MDRLIRYGDIGADPIYNCSARSSDLINSGVFEPEMTLGTGFCLFGIMNEILFVLCIKVMLEPPHKDYPAYKIMVVISLCDMCGSFYNTIILGIIYCFGTTFCEYAYIVYYIGAVAASFWMMGSQLSSILIINRLVELTCSENKMFTKIFNSKYTPISFLFPLSSGLYYLFYEQGLPFGKSSVGYFTPILIINNIIIIPVNCILSIILCFKIFKKLHENFGSTIDRRRQVTLFFQCLAMVTLCNVSSIMHTFNVFFTGIFIFQRMAGILYQLCTNLPPYIYLILNRTVRIGIIKILFGEKPLPMLSTSVKTTSTWYSRQFRVRPSISHSNMIANDQTINRFSKLKRIRCSVIHLRKTNALSSCIRLAMIFNNIFVILFYSISSIVQSFSTFTKKTWFNHTSSSPAHVVFTMINYKYPLLFHQIAEFLCQLYNKCISLSISLNRIVRQGIVKTFLKEKPPKSMLSTSTLSSRSFNYVFRRQNNFKLEQMAFT